MTTECKGADWSLVETKACWFCSCRTALTAGTDGRWFVACYDPPPNERKLPCMIQGPSMPTPAKAVEAWDLMSAAAHAYMGAVVPTREMSDVESEVAYANAPDDPMTDQEIEEVVTAATTFSEGATVLHVPSGLTGTVERVYSSGAHEVLVNVDGRADSIFAGAGTLTFGDEGAIP